MQQIKKTAEDNAAIANSLASQIRIKRQEIIANCDDNMDCIDVALGEELDKQLKQLKKRYITTRNKS